MNKIAAPAATVIPTSPTISEQLRLFALKVLVATAIPCFGLVVAAYTVSSQIQEATLLQGGPRFWSDLENRLYSFADAPDIPPQKKQRMIAALKKISTKYKPFVDALNGS